MKISKSLGSFGKKGDFSEKIWILRLLIICKRFQIKKILFLLAMLTSIMYIHNFWNKHYVHVVFRFIVISPRCIWVYENIETGAIIECEFEISNQVLDKKCLKRGPLSSIFFKIKIKNYLSFKQQEFKKYSIRNVQHSVSRNNNKFIRVMRS